MKHIAVVSRPPATASTTIDTISESKIGTKENFINSKAGSL